MLARNFRDSVAVNVSRHATYIKNVVSSFNVRIKARFDVNWRLVQAVVVEVVSDHYMAWASKEHVIIRERIAEEFLY